MTEKSAIIDDRQLAPGPHMVSNRPEVRMVQLDEGKEGVAPHGGQIAREYGKVGDLRYPR